MHRLLLVPLVILSGAATQTVRVGIDQVPPGAKCTESRSLESFIGQTASAELGARMMGAAQAPRLRWVQAGTAISTKYNSKRLTVTIDAQNRVVSARCN